MVIWRRDCELCHQDAEPSSDRIHEYVHGLIDAARTERDARQQDVDARIDELQSELREAEETIVDMLAELDQNEDEIQRLQDTIKKIKAGPAK